MLAETFKDTFLGGEGGKKVQNLDNALRKRLGFPGLGGLANFPKKKGKDHCEQEKLGWGRVWSSISNGNENHQTMRQG